MYGTDLEFVYRVLLVVWIAAVVVGLGYSVRKALRG